MNAIEVKDLSKTFKVKQKQKGFKGSLKSIFKPKYKEKKAYKIFCLPFLFTNGFLYVIIHLGDIYENYRN